MSEAETFSHMERKWDAGERHLIAGRYVAARRDLEAAEAIAWRKRDARALSRVYLPLLEARRQIRYNAAEGAVVIGSLGANAAAGQRLVRAFLRNESGTILLASSAGCGSRLAGSVQHTARRLEHCLEALLIVRHGREARLASPADSTFAGGLEIRCTTDPNEMIGPSTDRRVVVPLPAVGSYHAGDALHAVARESLIVAWEALALLWQHRHPLPRDAGPWDEIAWLRLALRIDPACEPITMRLVSLAETVERAG